MKIHWCLMLMMSLVTDPPAKSSPAPGWQSLCWLILQMSVLGFLSFGLVWVINQINVGVIGFLQFIFLAWEGGSRCCRSPKNLEKYSPLKELWRHKVKYWKPGKAKRRLSSTTPSVCLHDGRVFSYAFVCCVASPSFSALCSAWLCS